MSGYTIVAHSPGGTWFLVDYGAKRQKIITLSTAEAEMVALQVMLREVLTIMTLINMLGFHLAHVAVLCDSAAAVSIALSGISARLRYASKTVGLNAGWVSSVLASVQGMTLYKISTHINLADLFTKPLPTDLFQRMIKTIGWMRYEDWKNTRQCSGVHESPVGMTRCRVRVPRDGDPACETCRDPSSVGCACWAFSRKWDERTVEKAIIQANLVNKR